MRRSAGRQAPELKTDVATVAQESQDSLSFGGDGAGGGNRTPDLSLTKRLLYQLSYTGIGGAQYRQGPTRGQRRSLAPAADPDHDLDRDRLGARRQRRKTRELHGARRHVDQAAGGLL